MSDCAICWQLLRTPVKVLMCGHSFCLTCLRQLRQQTNGRWLVNVRMTLMCPNCRQVTTLPNGRIDELPTNYALNELLEIERHNNGLPEEPVVQANEGIDSALFDGRPLHGDIGNLNSVHSSTISSFNDSLNIGGDVASSSEYEPISTVSYLPSITYSTNRRSTSEIVSDNVIMVDEYDMQNFSRSATPISNFEESFNDDDEQGDEGWLCIDCIHYNIVNHYICERCRAIRQTTDSSAVSDDVDSNGHRYTLDTSSQRSSTSISSTRISERANETPTGIITILSRSSAPVTTLSRSSVSSDSFSE